MQCVRRFRNDGCLQCRTWCDVALRLGKVSVIMRLLRANAVASAACITAAVTVGADIAAGIAGIVSTDDIAAGIAGADAGGIIDAGPSADSIAGAGDAGREGLRQMAQVRPTTTSNLHQCYESASNASV